MSYRNPRFGAHHSALANGPGSLTLASGSVASGTIEALRDGRAGETVELAPQATVVVVDHDRSAATNAQRDIDRAVIPRGHTIAGKKVALLDSLAGEIPHAEHPQIASYAGHGTVAFPIDTSQSDSLIALRVPTSANIELGELWLTSTASPLTGVVPNYSPGDPIYQGSRTVLQSGAVVAQQTGPSRRVFAFQHEGLEGADLRLYQEQIAEAYGRGNTLLFDHPDSGDAHETVTDLDDTAKLTATNATLALVTGAEGPPSQAVAVTASSPGNVQIDIPFDGGLNGDPLSLGGADWFVDVRPAGMTWAANPSDMQVRWTTDALQRYTRYDIAGGWIDAINAGDSIDGKWHRYHLATQGSAIIGGSGPAMFDRVTTLRIQINGMATGESVTLQRIIRAPHDRAPVIAEWADFSYRQASSNPKGVAFYTVRAELVEVTT